MVRGIVPRRDDSIVQSLERAIDIMTWVANNPAKPSVADISQGLGLSKTTAHRLLSCLRAKGVAERDSSGRYRVGPLVLQWCNSVQNQAALATLVRPFLQELRDQTNETATFSLVVGRRRVYIEEAVSHRELRFANVVGKVLPLGRGAAGKAIMAYLPEEERAPALAAWEDFDLPPADPRLLEEELSVIKARGWASGMAEVIQGVAAVAAPVFDNTGRVIGAIALGGPIDRFPAEVIEAYARRVKEESVRVSRHLGWHGRRIGGSHG